MTSSMRRLFLLCGGAHLGPQRRGACGPLGPEHLFRGMGGRTGQVGEQASRRRIPSSTLRLGCGGASLPCCRTLAEPSFPRPWSFGAVGWGRGCRESWGRGGHPVVSPEQAAVWSWPWRLRPCTPLSCWGWRSARGPWTSGLMQVRAWCGHPGLCGLGSSCGTRDGARAGGGFPVSRWPCPPPPPAWAPFPIRPGFLANEMRPGEGLPGSLSHVRLRQERWLPDLGSLRGVGVPYPNHVASFGFPTGSWVAVEMGTELLSGAIEAPGSWVGMGVPACPLPPLPPHHPPLTQTSWCSMTLSTCGPPTSRASWCGRRRRPGSDQGPPLERTPSLRRPPSGPSRGGAGLQGASGRPALGGGFRSGGSWINTRPAGTCLVSECCFKAGRRHFGGSLGGGVCASRLGVGVAGFWLIPALWGPLSVAQMCPGPAHP